MKMNPALFIHPQDEFYVNFIQQRLIYRAMVWLCSSLFLKEEDLIMELKADGLEVNEDTLPDLYDQLLKVCRKFDMAVPKLYMKNQTENFQFYVFEDHAYILMNPVVNSRFTSDSIQLMLAIQCGHILCGSISNRTIVRRMIELLSKPKYISLKIVSWILKVNINKICRSNDFSADRFSMLFTESEHELVRECIAVAGGWKESISAKSQQDYVDTARQFKEQYGRYENRAFVEGRLSNFGFHERHRSYPRDRVAEATEWVESGEFHKLNLCLNHPEEAKEWPIPFNPKEVEGMPADEVIQNLSDGGFTNIQTSYSTKKTLKIDDGEVLSVLVDGKNEYQRGDWCSPDVPVLVEILKTTGSPSGQ